MKKSRTLNEAKLLYGDFSFVMSSNETITDHSVIATDKLGTNALATIITNGTILVSGKKVYALWSGGTKALSPYMIEFRATSSNGEKHIARATLWITE